ncbi:VOC family protein [Gymnodinialimonas sp.]
MGKVIGVGGVFMACAEPEATKRWYARVLGLEVDPDGGFSFSFPHQETAKAFPQGARTVFTPFAAGSDYFKPSTQLFMVNLIVDDLDAVLARCAVEGVAQVQPMETYDYGRFAWIMDPDGRK